MKADTAADTFESNNFSKRRRRRTLWRQPKDYQQAAARKIGKSEGFPGKEIPRDATPRRAGRGMKELRFPRPRVRESVQSDRNPQNLAGSVSIFGLVRPVVRNHM